MSVLHTCWQALRTLSGDDAYEKYLEHHNGFHANSLEVSPPLTRKEFFKLWQDSQWKEICRCC